jgi:hypothetical protein
MHLPKIKIIQLIIRGIFKKIEQETHFRAVTTYKMGKH